MEEGKLTHYSDCQNSELGFCHKSVGIGSLAGMLYGVPSILSLRWQGTLNRNSIIIASAGEATATISSADSQEGKPLLLVFVPGSVWTGGIKKAAWKVKASSEARKRKRGCV